MLKSMVSVGVKVINLMKYKVKIIASDASSRTFSRVLINKRYKILVSSKTNKYSNLIAYTAINKFLRKKKFLAPKLFSHDYTKGTILIEDFGDISFHRILNKEKKKFDIYKKLVDLLLDIQKIKPEKKIKNIINNSHFVEVYSLKHLVKESDLFFDWYLPLIFKKTRVLNIKKKTKKALSKIYKKLYFPNRYFVHRDYHTQNLMKVGKKIGILDSQDALIGNPAYDLASLIDDVRIETSKKLKNNIYNYYINNTSSNLKKNKNFFIDDFNILSVQRSLKIIGIFSRLYKRDKKDKYLKMIPYTWKLLELRMKSKTFRELRDILDFNISKKTRDFFLYK